MSEPLEIPDTTVTVPDNVLPEPGKRYEPNPLWTPEWQKPCRCGGYIQEDGRFMRFYCSIEHFLD